MKISCWARAIKNRLCEKLTDETFDRQKFPELGSTLFHSQNNSAKQLGDYEHLCTVIWTLSQHASTVFAVFVYFNWVDVLRDLTQNKDNAH